MSATEELFNEWRDAKNGFSAGVDFKVWLAVNVEQLRAAVADRDAAIARAVAEERESCAVGLESLKQVRIPEPFRKCGFYDHLNEDDDGWRDLSRDEKSSLATAAAAIRARGERKE